MPATAHTVDPSFDEAIINAAARYKYDPVGWANFAFDWEMGDLEGQTGLRVWQGDICQLITDHLANPETRFDPLQIAVASGHGIGKSSLMGILSNWAMSCWADAKVLTTANTDPQLRTKTSPEIGLWFKRSITAHWFDVQTMSIKSKATGHRDSWKQDFVTWSEYNTQAFAGLHNLKRIILLEFDEASTIHDKVWEVAEGAMTDEDTVIIWIVFGNPTENSGRFRECFRRFRHRWITRQIDSRNVEGTNKEFLNKLIADNGEDSDIARVRVKGQFPRQSAMQFIGEDDVEAAANRHLKKEQFEFAPVILGVDPAWSGEDKLEVYLRQGLYSKSLLSMPKNDDDFHVANVIARFEEEHKVDAVFIDAGYGTGIYSAGKTLGRNWRLIWFSGKPINVGYLNKRAEIWGGMKDWLKQGGVIDPDDYDLYQDLIGPETKFRPDGVIQLESKDDMKKRGLPSPNKADALALTFAEPVARKSLDHFKHSDGEVEVDYNPYDH